MFDRQLIGIRTAPSSGEAGVYSDGRIVRYPEQNNGNMPGRRSRAIGASDPPDRSFALTINRLGFRHGSHCCQQAPSDPTGQLASPRAPVPSYLKHSQRFPGSFRESRRLLDISFMRDIMHAGVRRSAFMEAFAKE